MSIHQLKDGRWICRHPVGTDPQRPTANKKYFGRGEEAERAAAEFDRAVKFVRRPKGGRSPLFVDLVNEYLTAKGRQLSASTAFKCINRMRGTILPIIGQEMCHGLSPERLDRYSSQRIEEGVKRTTVHRELTDIRAVLRFAVKRRIIASNPMEGFEFPTRDNAIIQPPTAAEFAAILACAVPHLQRAMLVSWHTGLRPGEVELSRLRWDAVDFIGKTLMVISAAKGGMPSRMVPLNKAILRHLERWYDEDLKSGIPYIIHYQGLPPASLKTAWRKAKLRARVTRRIRLYDIRHAFATTLLAAGANLKAVSEILGHSSPELTVRTYQHVDNDLKRAAVGLMDEE